MIKAEIIANCNDILLDLSDDGYECSVLANDVRIWIIIKCSNDLRPPICHSSDSLGRLNDYLELKKYRMYLNGIERVKGIEEYQQYEYIFKLMRHI